MILDGLGINIVLAAGHPGRAGRAPRVRPLRRRPGAPGVRVHEFGIGFPPRALDPPPRQGDDLHPQLAAHRRLRAARGEEGDSDDPRAFVNQRLRTRLVILLAGRGHELPARVAHLLAHRRRSPIRSPTSSRRLRAAGLAGRPRPGSWAACRPAPTRDGSAHLRRVGRPDPRHRRSALPGVRRHRRRHGRHAPLRYLRAHAGRDRSMLTVRHRDGTVEDEVGHAAHAGEVAEQGALGIRVRAATPRRTSSTAPSTRSSIGFQRDRSTRRRSSCAASATSIANLANPPVPGPVGMVGHRGQRPRPSCRPSSCSGSSGVLSANLAVVNALPFPPLDGGRVAMALLQARQPARASAPRPSAASTCTGFVGLMALLVWVTDVRHPPARRRMTRQRRIAAAAPDVTVDVGGVPVGSRHPVVVQSMTNTDTADADATALQVAALAHAGSELVRITVNNDAAARGRAGDPAQARRPGRRRAAHRRLPLQRPPAAGRVPGAWPGRSPSTASTRATSAPSATTSTSRRSSASPSSTTSRCASASTGARSTRRC